MRIKIAGLVVAALGIGGAQVVSAADLPRKAPVYQAAPSSAYNWTGWYAGANVGYGWGRSDNTFTQVAPAANFPFGADRTNLDGVIGGLQAGYNWQTGAWILGLESDIQIAGQKGSGTAATPPPACAGTCSVTHSEKLSWFGTTRGRVGWTFDRWMVYGTGGAAYGDVKVNGVFNAPIVPVFGPFNGSSTRLGWTVGAGVEAALTGNWTWKLEYLYIDLGRATYATPLPPPFIAGSLAQDSVRIRDNVVRLGFNYRF